MSNKAGKAASRKKGGKQISGNKSNQIPEFHGTTISEISRVSPGIFAHCW
jgi:hypothetical protein